MSNDRRSMRERMLAGDLYIADDPELQGEMRRAALLTERYNQSSVGAARCGVRAWRNLHPPEVFCRHPTPKPPTSLDGIGPTAFP